MDLTESIAPKSDQLNAEDLLAGPRTFTIKEVKRGSAEQPVDIHLVEFPGRPFKPSKTVRRVLVSAWGPDASAYAGRRMTLFRDPTVKWAGQEVGGIRVSHLSHIEKPVTVALTVAQGKRAPFVVKPLPAEPVAAIRPVDPPDGSITQDQLGTLGRLLKAAGIEEREVALAYMSQTVDREIGGTRDLTKVEAAKVIGKLEREAAA